MARLARPGLATTRQVPRRAFTVCGCERDRITSQESGQPGHVYVSYAVSPGFTQHVLVELRFSR